MEDIISAIIISTTPIQPVAPEFYEYTFETQDESNVSLETVVISATSLEEAKKLMTKTYDKFITL